MRNRYKAFEIASDVKEILGIDISSKMIGIAKRKAAEGKIENIDFQRATIFDEMLKKESFDVILAFNILHYLEDTQVVMKRINELLKPGGLFISSNRMYGRGKETFKNFYISFTVYPHQGRRIICEILSNL